MLVLISKSYLIETTQKCFDALNENTEQALEQAEGTLDGMVTVERYVGPSRRMDAEWTTDDLEEAGIDVETNDDSDE